MKHYGSLQGSARPTLRSRRLAQIPLALLVIVVSCHAPWSSAQGAPCSPLDKPPWKGLAVETASLRGYDAFNARLHGVIPWDRFAGRWWSRDERPLTLNIAIKSATSMDESAIQAVFQAAPTKGFALNVVSTSRSMADLSGLQRRVINALGTTIASTTDQRPDTGQVVVTVARNDLRRASAAVSRLDAGCSILVVAGDPTAQLR
jgi:hypothetical protein